MRPSSKKISRACHFGPLSKPSGAEFDGFRGQLNQSRFGSSSGIHSLIACQGGSKRSMVSKSIGDGGGRGRWMITSQRAGDEGLLASGIVGLEGVVADGLLAFGRDVSPQS